MGKKKVAFFIMGNKKGYETYFLKDKNNSKIMSEVVGCWSPPNCT